MGSLRDEQKQIARDRILEAVAAEIAEHGLRELSIPAVAERAGISQRTIYNHFENKDSLVRSLDAWSEAWMEERGGVAVEADMDKIPDAIRINFGLFSEMGTLTTALGRVRADFRLTANEGASLGPGHEARTEVTRDWIRRLRPDLAPSEVAMFAACFRSLISFENWNRLTSDGGLSGEDAGAVTAWAFSTLMSAVKDGAGPSDEE